jgi:hypothetical protein
MDFAHVRQRLHAFAGRISRSAGATGDESSSLERASASRDAAAGLRSMSSLGAGRR